MTLKQRIRLVDGVGQSGEVFCMVGFTGAAVALVATMFCTIALGMDVAWLWTGGLVLLGTGLGGLAVIALAAVLDRWLVDGWRP